MTLEPLGSARPLAPGGIPLRPNAFLNSTAFETPLTPAPTTLSSGHEPLPVGLNPAPLAIEARKPIETFYLKGSWVPGGTPRPKFEPEVVLNVVAMAWAKAGGGWNGEQLKSILPQVAMPPAEVLRSAATWLRTTPEALGDYLRTQPWKHTDFYPEPRFTAPRELLNRFSSWIKGPMEYVVAEPTDMNAAVKASDLTQDQLNIMLLNSRGFQAAEEFAANPLRDSGKASRDGLHGYLLGLGMFQDLASFRAAYASGMRPFVDGYEHAFHATQEAQTERYLDFITASGEPVTFLVPPHAMTSSLGHVTQGEFKWLFAHPERMKNVTFVFGGYQTSPA